MTRGEMLVAYFALIAIVIASTLLFGHYERQIALRDERIHQLKVERDSAELRYFRAKQAVVHDTVVVRQAVTRWREKADPVRAAIDSGLPTIGVATVQELLDRGDNLASRCAQHLDHTEALIQSADTLNLASKAEIRALGKRKPSKVGRIAKGTVLVLAGVGLGAILF